MFLRIVPKQSNEHRYLRISDPDTWFNQHTHMHTDVHSENTVAQKFISCSSFSLVSITEKSQHAS